MMREMGSALAWQRGRRGLHAPSLVVLAGLSLALFAQAVSACYDFTYEERAADAAPPTPEGGGEGGGPSCVVGASYCGGDQVPGAADTLYRCVEDGGGTLLKKCASGCVRDGGATGPRCNVPATPCKAGGSYCGGDKLDGDPSILYRCVAGGAPTILERCTKGCRVNSAGNDDDCEP
jgi:hypothetical protein